MINRIFDTTLEIENEQQTWWTKNIAVLDAVYTPSVVNIHYLNHTLRLYIWQ